MRVSCQKSKTQQNILRFVPVFDFVSRSVWYSFSGRHLAFSVLFIRCLRENESVVSSEVRCVLVCEDLFHCCALDPINVDRFVLCLLNYFSLLLYFVLLLILSLLILLLPLLHSIKTNGTSFDIYTHESLTDIECWLNIDREGMQSKEKWPVLIDLSAAAMRCMTWSAVWRLTVLTMFL